MQNYKLWNPETKKMIVFRDAAFNKSSNSVSSHKYFELIDSPLQNFDTALGDENADNNIKSTPPDKDSSYFDQNEKPVDADLFEAPPSQASPKGLRQSYQVSRNPKQFWAAISEYHEVL